MKKISHPTITFLAITTLALTITGWCWNQLSPFLSGIFVFDIKEYFKTSFYGIILCTIWLYTTRKRHRSCFEFLQKVFLGLMYPFSCVLWAIFWFFSLLFFVR